jgi:hypothetical protein
MRSRLASLVLVVLAVGCGGATGAPARVRPTLDAIGALAFACGEGIRDNVPSGLSQWRCEGIIGGAGATILVDGKEEGVTGITLDIHSSNDLSAAHGGFRRIVAAVPPLSSAPALMDTLDDWNGQQRRVIVGAIAVSAVCDVTQCIVGLASADDPLRPIPVP